MKFKTTPTRIDFLTARREKLYAMFNMQLKIIDADDGSDLFVINDGISRMTMIEELRRRIAVEMSIDENSPTTLQLYYSDTELKDGQKLSDYRINNGTVVKVRKILSPPPVTTEKNQSKLRDRCSICDDDPTKKQSCRHCSCVVCGKDDRGYVLLICDGCNHVYHTYCLQPMLHYVPWGDWFCPECKIDDGGATNTTVDDQIIVGEVVESGRKKKLPSKIGRGKKVLTKIARVKKVLTTTKRHNLRLRSTKTKRPSFVNNLSCARRHSVPTVAIDHFGQIHGVEVGTNWRRRIQASEAGVHRPLVAGIHGKEKDGAYSIVVSGGYIDDKDTGDTIVYTGSGGRDLSGNKRCAEKQSKNQTLDRNNAALARSCFTGSSELDEMNGGDAGDDWKKGKAVRVVRSFKSKGGYGPKEGIRYDGIYKVKRYWPENGEDGFIVWRYELARDDETPAPWTEEGKALIKRRGLDKVREWENADMNVKRTHEDNDEGPPKKKPRLVSAAGPSKKQAKTVSAGGSSTKQAKTVSAAGPSTKKPKVVKKKTAASRKKNKNPNNIPSSIQSNLSHWIIWENPDADWNRTGGDENAVATTDETVVKKEETDDE